MEINWLDITTAALGLAYILLEYRASIWMWAVGAVMQLLGIVLYYQKGLYADCGMEFYYLAMTAYGAFRWQKKETNDSPSSQETTSLRGRAGGGSPITHIPLRLAALWTVIFLVLWALIWYLLSHFTDSTVPIADAFTTALSLVGIWGQVLMDVQYKRTEIAVKRVFGAGTDRITGEGLLFYLRTVAICYVIAAPLGWLLVHYYLQRFSHRVGFSLTVFLVALLTVAALCSLVVLYHYVKTARTNPAVALKSE